MSADVWIERKACSTCGRADETEARLNVTYNLSGMLKAAGFCGWSALAEMSARDAGKHMLTVLDGMRDDESRWRAMNPENGWGDYDRCLQGRMRDFAETCISEPDDSRLGSWL